MRAALLVLLSANALHAQDLKDRFNIRVSLTGMYLAEQENGSGLNNVASPFQIGFGDLRVALDARRLPGKFELHFDGRVRLTGEYSVDAASVGANQVTARGYLGGKEYDLRQIWILRRGQKVDFALGRLVIAEADFLRVDGARLWWRVARHWDVSAFAGGYPAPYSRSVTSDYILGKGVQGLALAGGLDTSYTYDRIWGSVSVVGAYLGGLNDGGNFNPASPAGVYNTETPRGYLTWTSFERFTKWLDVYHDLVFDFVGSAGPQLTRLDLFASARLPRFFTFRLGYDHMSAVAIEMYLTRLLNNRVEFLAGTIENNLVITRTARDEGSLNVDFTVGKFSAFGDGRIRVRAIVNPQHDPQFLNGAGEQVAPGLAYDLTLGVRDRGSLKGIRASLWYTYLRDYRARNHILALEAGHSFLDERLTFDMMFIYANTHDDQVGQGAACVPPLMTPITSATCWGTRIGDEYEVGVTFTGLAWKHWFGLLDYRLLVDTMTNSADKPLFTHMLLLRLEARY